ncbi:hypothetical protein Daura_22545 [Dactylosporangium aurantiacum]|uniref:Uncharacterized protein n=1 Tax=Dactylosporangium aurantiacum TaxID=35754 RepID=A0A9Q9ISP7_9ACTN|nr:hypothetical protein [Dactylosporangium aurantiacum]MDG6107711.1 hypothetical protein [Dactylosporangium aurantiacum]UWZ58699.1 hypothetical protein Daura_22545 [Dactylosporangium aurantiacum]
MTAYEHVIVVVDPTTSESRWPDGQWKRQTPPGGSAEVRQISPARIITAEGERWLPSMTGPPGEWRKPLAANTDPFQAIHLTRLLDEFTRLGWRLVSQAGGWHAWLLQRPLTDNEQPSP